MNMTKMMTVMAVALAAMAGQAGESSEFRLDTRDGARMARVVETIAYSTAWNNGGAVTVAVDSVTIKKTDTPASGDVIWNAAQATPGTHTLTHECGGETLTAVFEVLPPPPLTLAAESADWSSGSITLRCTDTDTSGVEHTYGLMYYEENEPTKKWYGIDGAQTIKAVREIDANGESVLVARLPDPRFAKRLDGIQTVKYRVMDETGRMAECTTRNRHGLFVAVNDYENAWLDSHANHTYQVSVFRGAYIKYGGAKGSVQTLSGSKAKKDTILRYLGHMSEISAPGDIFLFYYVGHGADGFLTCYDKNQFISASALSSRFHEFSDGVAVAVLIDSCHSSSMIDRSGIDGMGNVAWIAAAQASDTTYCGAFKAVVCDKGWLNGEADVPGGNVFADGNGYVTLGELAAWGQQWMGNRENFKSDEPPFSPQDFGHMISYYNSLVLDNIVIGKVPHSHTSNRLWEWLTAYPYLLSTSQGDETVAAAMTAANGRRTVGECYALCIDPEDPNDDLKITHFEMKGGKPVVTLNHTEDGSGNSFTPRVKTLGKANLSDAEWREVPEGGDASLRFFKVVVELP